MLSSFCYALLHFVFDLLDYGSFQILPYDVLMQELDVINVRELEDFLINECMYVVGTSHDIITCLNLYIPT